MMDLDNLLDRDRAHLWHPCSQMKDYEIFKPIVITGAEGSYIQTSQGKLIDAISSWWCKSLGHQHPRLKKALLNQLQKFEHVILANTTHQTIVDLSEKLAQLMPNLQKVFYAGDGSCAVEIAMKMSLHARQIEGQSQKTQFIALTNGYHGETIGAMSVSDVGLYREPYQSVLFETQFIEPPYLTGIHDPLWTDASVFWKQTEKKLEPYKGSTTAIIFEPIVQGAAGMQIYSADFLKRLCGWAKKNNIHVIADEIMTGLGRTGKMLACEYADIQPDFLCLSKSLTSGWLPFSAVLTSNAIYELFYDDYEKGKSFLHSHTYSGNALGAAIALEVLHILEQDSVCEQANQLGQHMLQNMNAIANETGKLQNVRGIGAIVAADLITDEPKRRLGFEVYRKAVSMGALLRPMGNTIYWLPPLNTKMKTIEELAEITRKAILAS